MNNKTWMCAKSFSTQGKGKRGICSVRVPERAPRGFHEGPCYDEVLKAWDEDAIYRLESIETVKKQMIQDWGSWEAVPNDIKRLVIRYPHRYIRLPISSFAVDEHGCPIVMSESGNEAKHCPLLPCRYCFSGGPAAYKNPIMDDYGTLVHVRETSWEWCQRMDTCAATIDWDKIFGH